MTKNIAILGATSHIAKGLIRKFLRSSEFDLHLYSRSPTKVRDFLDYIGKPLHRHCAVRQGYSDFFDYHYDVVINCVGVGTREKLKGDYTLYFRITEKYDNMVIDYLHKKNPDALYISFSSGAVYGREHTTPVENGTGNFIKVNHIMSEDYYSIARLNSEAKHRAFSGLNIVDLRIFSYFSRFIDLADGYLITEIMGSILKNKIFVTNRMNIVRDYLHPHDLFSIVRKCINLCNINMALDVVSAKPVAKIEILDFFESEYGLQFEIDKTRNDKSATGFKSVYCSKYDAARKIGYQPKFTSMDAIQREAKKILYRRSGCLQNGHALA